jgi:phosphate transport system permease protein
MNDYQNTKIDEPLPKELCGQLPKARLVFSFFMNMTALFFTILSLIPLLSILWEIFWRGITTIKLEMFTNSVIDNGFSNAILGTLTMLLIASLFSFPVGILAGIFLAEFGQKYPRIKFSVNFVVNILTGVPSIIVGVCVYDIVVLSSKSFSAFAGGISLSIIMLPIIILTTEESLKLIPISQRLASAALGDTRLQTIFRVIITAAIPGITTGILLAVARAAGETAPLIFTALFSQNWSDGLSSPTASLPILIFNLYNDPDPQKSKLVWTAAIVLLSLVLSLNIFTRSFTNKKSIN